MRQLDLKTRLMRYPCSYLILSDACTALEEAQHKVERLYVRWQELEAKRNGGGN